MVSKNFSKENDFHWFPDDEGHLQRIFQPIEMDFIRTIFTYSYFTTNGVL
jgi:hypothetical protein